MTERVQVNYERNMPGLAPQAAPIDTFVRPVRDISTAQIADALSVFNSALQRYGTASMEKNREEQETLAEAKIGGMTFEEAQTALNDGSLAEFDDPWFKAAFQKQYGMRLGTKRQEEIRTAYETSFDKEGGNLDAFLAEQFQQDEQAIGNDPLVMAGYRHGQQHFAETRCYPPSAFVLVGFFFDVL